MAKTKGFLEYNRQPVGHRPIEERTGDFREIEIPLSPDDIKKQAARCSDCGIPFCHGTGCPIKNRIPEFNELVFQGRWRQACENLHSTNNFPEITGRVCPAPCETSCTLAVNDQPVLIRHIEYQIVERGFAEGWIKPLLAGQKTGRQAAVIGSGPAGLAAAQQLARAGHDVSVFERDELPGGLMRYGIPDFKLEKWVLDRRLEQLGAEGVHFHNGVDAGRDISARYLMKMFNAVCLTMGATQPRDIDVPGREFGNIHFAMDYLSQQNRIIAGQSFDPAARISANGRNVVVIGGGDTGSDCVGTARRQGAKTITQLEILPKPPDNRPTDTPWPMWPRMMRTSSCQEEGCDRRWSVLAKKFAGDHTGVKEIHACVVEWYKAGEQWKMKETPGTDFVLPAEIVLLAMGFVHVQCNQLIKELDIRLDDRGNVMTENFQTSNPAVFAAGDTILGASLVVKAIDSGRLAAEAIDHWLKQSG